MTSSLRRIDESCRVSSIRRSVYPMIPLRGVRISWLMLARKSLFAELARSASWRASSAWRRACSALVFARMSSASAVLRFGDVEVQSDHAHRLTIGVVIGAADAAQPTFRCRPAPGRGTRWNRSYSYRRRLAPRR